MSCRLTVVGKELDVAAFLKMAIELSSRGEPASFRSSTEGFSHATQGVSWTCSGDCSDPDIRGPDCSRADTAGLRAGLAASRPCRSVRQTQREDLSSRHRTKRGSVATSLTLKLHKVTNVQGGNLVFRADQAGNLLRAFRAFAKGIPDELILIAEFVPGQGGKPIFVVQACYVDDMARTTMIDGLSRDERFFLSWATSWRNKYTPQYQKVQLRTDTYAPSSVRSYAPSSNMATFAAAFSCKSGDAMDLNEAQRVGIW